MKRQVLIRVLFLLGVIAIGLRPSAFSQTERFLIEGKVNDPEGKDAVGARIVVKGTTNGTVTDVNGLFSIQVPSEQAILIIRHFSTSEVWEASFEAGKKYEIKLAPDSVSERKQVFDRVEELPRPAAGEDGWYTYLAKTIKYSKSDRDAKVQGTIIVGFEIQSDGSIHNVEVLRGIGGDCDKEAIRVVAAGPNWHPGKIDGEAVNTRMSMPIQFKLNGSGYADNSRETAIRNLYGEESVVVIGYLPQASR